jgi:hypothetical protein
VPTVGGIVSILAVPVVFVAQLATVAMVFLADNSITVVQNPDRGDMLWKVVNGLPQVVSIGALLDAD